MHRVDRIQHKQKRSGGKIDDAHKNSRVRGKFTHPAMLEVRGKARVIIKMSDPAETCAKPYLYSDSF
jgi:hypothetical protein